jgi:hypothetical protein
MKLAIPQAVEFGKHLLIAQGVPEDIVFDVAEHLVSSDQVGYTSHGLSILPTYQRVLSESFVQADTRPRTDQRSGRHVGFRWAQGIRAAFVQGRDATIHRTHPRTWPMYRHLAPQPSFGSYGVLRRDGGGLEFDFVSVYQRDQSRSYRRSLRWRSRSHDHQPAMLCKPFS